MGALQARLQAEPELQALYTDMERPLRRALTTMERHGVLVDAAALVAQGRQLGHRMQEIEAAAHALAGTPFNLASPKQLAHVRTKTPSVCWVRAKVRVWVRARVAGRPNPNPNSPWREPGCPIRRSNSRTGATSSLATSTRLHQHTAEHARTRTTHVEVA